MDWPSGFLWGTGASSTQCEGAATSSDWWAFEQAGKVPPSGDGSGFATRFREDFAILASLGLTHHRLSLDWARLEPEPGRRDPQVVEHYRDVLGAAHEAGISPWVTLHHFALPQWVADAGGFLEPLIRTEAWAAHVDFVAETFGDLVEGWKPINEANLYAVLAYEAGVIPPGTHDRAVAALAQEQILLANAEAAVRLKATGRPVASVFSLSAVVELDDDPATRSYAAHLDRRLWRPGIDLFRDGVLRVVDREPIERPDLAGSFDLIGFSYYAGIGIREGTRGTHPPGAPLSPLGYGIWADGVGVVLDKLTAELPTTPLLVAEYGIGTDDDVERTAYLERGLEVAHAALERGVDLRGFFHWTSVDNYEWGLGHDVRFGIIDRDRTVKPSTAVLAREAARALRRIETQIRPSARGSPGSVVRSGGTTWSPSPRGRASNRGNPLHDLVIRGGNVVDGTGAPARTADVAIDGDQIVEVGRVSERGHHEIDADGALVAPGWVDIHTHYDGQAIWDAEMAPSAHHGVTTAVMGNCGVGFAPVRPGEEDFLVEVMEAVEDIPGTALHEGIEWQWETFGQYLDALATKARTIDLGTQVPHAAVRAYVLGDRAHEDDLTADEYRRIADVVADGVRSGALGFSTSRTILHRSKYGYVPGTFAIDDELSVIADALSSVGRGLFQFVSDDRPELPDREMMEGLTRRGIDVTYSMAQTPRAPTAFRDSLADADRINRSGGSRITPQVPARPTGMLFGLKSSFHPFVAHPTFRAMSDLPYAELIARLRQPDVRAALLAEEPRTRQASAEYLATAWHQMYRLGVEPDYEPTRESSALATAEREGRHPQAVVLDWLLEDDGDALLFSPLGSYVDQDHEAIREMILHPASILGLSDGGAHCGLICDASFPTYLLTHWARDRTRGELIPIEHLVHKQTQATAVAYGMTDRGVLAPGMLADVNVIDHEGLRLHRPRMVYDLPAGGKRLLQDVEGYRVTVKAGETTFVDGEVTDARPGRTLRATDGGVVRT